MLRERWQTVERLYHAAIELAPELRSKFLVEATIGDRELFEEVDSLLKQTTTDSRLDRPVWQSRAIGSQLGSYEIECFLGSGGMGEVFRARDLRLNRTVAIKISKGRFTGGFKREARVASALKHPNIVQIHELISSENDDCIVMEFVPGRTLAQLIGEQLLPIPQAVLWAHQIASALAAAHGSGVVHRDIKPSNIIANNASVVKVLDFGLAKYVNGGSPDPSVVSETATGAALGTPSYMAPEQAQGRPADFRSDVFSCGAVLYEMFTGNRAFSGDSTYGILSRVVNDSPPDVRRIRRDVPRAIAFVVARCLEKDPKRRYSSGLELAAALTEAERRTQSGPRVFLASAVLAAILIGTIAVAFWLHSRNVRLQWARTEAPSKIQSRILESDYYGAFALTKAALRYQPDNPQLKQHWENVSLPLSMTTDPAGARVSMRPFGSADVPWEQFGTTPLDKVRVPFANLRVRIEKEGRDPLEFSAFTLFLQGQKIRLHVPSAVPAGTVLVPEHSPPMGPIKIMQLPDFFIDKFEVTNRQFQRFIDSGGYRIRNYWRHEFVNYGNQLFWQDAITSFRDTTGRPGPATWELGTFPKDQAEYPVAGVSWFEAAAYCESVGKALPTLYHWRKAAGFGLYSDILLSSNFAGKGTMRVGANPGITPFGAYDMAGNVKEWVLNKVGDRRLILGGSFGEPSYPFDELDARNPFARLPAFGIRCASYPSSPPVEAFLPVTPSGRNHLNEKPVGDKTFEKFRQLYRYDKIPLDIKTEKVDDSNALWKTERVSYAATYNRERIPAYLFLPKNVKPPYQTVLFVPGGWAFVLRNSVTGVSTDQFDFLLRTGRAVLYPVYKGTFERRVENVQSPNVFREIAIAIAKDVFRSVDYLETRSDVLIPKLGYYGMSFGGSFGPVLLALDSRFKAGVLNGGALNSERVAPEIDNFNFAPRVRAPTLMFGGRHDFVAPPATLQEPMYRLLGTPAPDKRFVQFDSGHIPPLRDATRETLNWFDHYLGALSPIIGGDH